MTLRRALVGFVAAGCLFLLLEVVPSHREVVREKLVAAVPTIVSVLGLLAFAVAFVGLERHNSAHRSGCQCPAAVSRHLGRLLPQR